MTDKITQNVVKQLDVLEKNINELQKSLQDAYKRIGELTSELYEIKQKNNTREPFNEQKLREGLYRALEKRPVGEEEVETLIEDIKKDIRSSGEREIPSRLIGEVVMQNLRKIDEVAFIRFASVYRRFEDITEFSEEVERLTKD